MASFEEIVNQQLCRMNSTLEKIKLLNEAWEKRETEIVFITIPENGGTRSFSVGTTKINFRNGQITNPDGSVEQIQTKLDAYQLQWLHSISFDANQDIIIKLDGKPKRTVSANFSTQIPYLTYYSLEITCTVATDIQVFACTNPAAVIGQFKVTTVNILEQQSINGDTTEAQTWDTVYNLSNNLNRIRKKLNDIIGGTAWTDAVSASLGTIWAKFNATTGHKNSGAADDAGQVDHVNLANKGTNTHAQIDTHIGTGSHVTGGDLHDHSGGDGAQINHTTLSNIGTNTHAQIDTVISSLSGVILPYGGASAPSGWLLCDGQAVSRTTYSTLFSIIGTSYGVGDGSTTFNVPNMVGRIPVCIGGSGVTNRGDVGGEQTHALTSGEIPAHDHGSAGGHTHDTIADHQHAQYTKNNATLGTGSPMGNNNSTPTDANSSTGLAGGHTHSSDGAHTHTSVGSNGAHQNMQPYLGVQYIIKT